MSDFGSDYGYVNPILNHSAPLEYGIEDIYHITRGTFNEFNMKGYNAPTTAVPLSKEYKIPLDKNRDIFADVNKKAKEPDATTYAADKDKIYKRYWEKAAGKFHKGRRHTFTEETIKISSKLPGPGAYMPIPKGNPPKKTSKNGKFE
jgi:hypothetical protein